MVLVLLALPSAWASVSDARCRVIPNGACALVALVGLAFQLVRAVAADVVATLPVEAGLSRALPGPGSCCVAAVVVLILGGVGELAVRRVLGRSGVGMGDVKLCAAWACCLGWLVLPAVAVACFAGAVCALARRQRTFALGPWLAAAFVALGTALSWLGSAAPNLAVLPGA